MVPDIYSWRAGMAAILLCFGFSTASLPGAEQSAPSGLAAARKAIGTDATSVRALTLHGTVREGFSGVTALPTQDPMAFEIRVLLPDHYVRIHTFGIGKRQRIFDGYAGEKAFYRPFQIQSDGSLVPRSVQSAGSQLLDRHRSYATRLLLGLLADPVAVTRLRTKPAAGTRQSVAFTGLDGREITLDLHSDSNLPHRVRYVDDVRYPVPMSDADKKAGRMGNWKIEKGEVTFTFEDHRQVGKLRLPHLIRQTALGHRFQEIRVDRYVINPPLTPKDFLQPD